jgi:3-methyl-2-oxobutanoate hydroxymethyltransferase
MTEQDDDKRITLRDLRRWAREGSPFAMLTCYDATTAKWLWRGGIRTMLVGDTAAQVILGHDSTLPATMDFMVTITAAVRRGAPKALVMADMPFGSYQAEPAEAVRNASRFLKEAGADLVKLEVTDRDAELVERLAHAGVPVVAHIGSRPQHVRAEGGYRSAGKSEAEAAKLADTASLLAGCGASALLVEAVPGEVGRRVVDAANTAAAPSPPRGEHLKEGIGARPQGPAAGGPVRVPVIGCGAGPACHGHVVVLQDLLGMTDWQPPFVTPTGDLGRHTQAAAEQWRELVESGQYLKDGGPYPMR